MSNRWLFTMVVLTVWRRLIHQENLITQTHSMEHDQILSTQPVDGKEQLRPTEIRSLRDEGIYHQPLIPLKQVQHRFVCILISCAHNQFLLF